MPSTEATSEPSTTTLSITTVLTPPPLPSKVMGVRVTPSVEDTSPTLTVMWQTLASGSVTYTVKYSTQPGEVSIPPEGALEVTGIRGTSTILTTLERGTTYYIWVVGVSKRGEGPHSDRTSEVTYDSELRSTNCTSILIRRHKWVNCFAILYTAILFSFHSLYFVPIIKVFWYPASKQWQSILYHFHRDIK